MSFDPRGKRFEFPSSEQSPYSHAFTSLLELAVVCADCTGFAPAQCIMYGGFRTWTLVVAEDLAGNLLSKSRE
ncbi:hypothetical protein [Bartonella sp. CL48QHWL]|uniref:hypothetical protein n=1 Tax=Bartonella sp. CL48QHWL TaxID=3243535 RepID=UPI0035D0D278